MPAWWGSGKSPVPGCRLLTLHCTITRQEHWRALWSSFYRGTNPIHKGSPIWPNHLSKASSPDTITVGLEFQHMNFGGPAMTPHSSTLAWKIPWTEEPGGLQSMGSDMTERLHFHFSLSCIGEGNGNPLQCSCLENPRDGGAWWAPICAVTQSQTRLKRLSSSSSIVFC